MVIEGGNPPGTGPGMGVTGIAFATVESTVGVAGIQGPVGIQGIQGPITHIPENIQKLNLKSGDVLIIHYPEYLDQHELRNIITALQRVNKRLMERGIELTDIVLFKEGVRISILSPTEEENKTEYRRIEL